VTAADATVGLVDAAGMPADEVAEEAQVAEKKGDEKAEGAVQQR
jgi:hypothetical protein